MAQVCSDAPRSGGKTLNTNENAFGLLRDSSGSIPYPDELRARLAADGYLYLKDFFPREDVLKVREGILDRLRKED